MTNSPRQEIFTMCRQAAVRVLGESSVFDYLPGKEARYPFVFIGEQYGEDIRYKTVVAGDCTQTIHVYHNDPGKRGSTQSMMDRVLHEIRKVKHTRTFYIELVDTRTQMLTDNTTSTPLLHGVLELRFKFY